MTPWGYDLCSQHVVERPYTAEQLPLHILSLYEVESLVAGYRFQKWHKGAKS
jgi:hypothetical protein